MPWGHIVQICEANTACKVCRIHVAFVVSVGGSGSTHRRLCTARAADSILPCTPPGQFHSCNLARTKLPTSKNSHHVTIHPGKADKSERDGPSYFFDWVGFRLHGQVHLLGWVISHRFQKQTSNLMKLELRVRTGAENHSRQLERTHCG